jgi:hypothetical protein
MKGSMTTTTKLQKITRLSAGALVAGLMMTGLATPASATPTPVQATSAAASAEPAGPMQGLGCSGQWDITQINIKQANGWYMMLEDQQLFGNLIWGRAWQAYSATGSKGYGKPQGTVKGNKIEFSVSWDNGAFGSYTGTIDNEGFASGEARDKASGATTTWHLTRRADCL